MFFSMRYRQPDPSTRLIVYVLYATNPQGFINIDWRHKMDGILLAGPGSGNTLHFSDESKTTHNGTCASKTVFHSDFFFLSFDFFFFFYLSSFVPLALSGTAW